MAGSVSVSDGTYAWSQSGGSSNEDDFNASFSTNLNRITVNYFAGAPDDGRQIEVTYRYGAAGIVGALSSGSGHWLQLSIDGQVQATRERVLAVPFALYAGKLVEEGKVKVKNYFQIYKEINLGDAALVASHGNFIGLIINLFQPDFVYDQWKNMSMPDLYRIDFFHEKNTVVEHIGVEGVSTFKIQ